jgi:hypothetical protein
LTVVADLDLEALAGRDLDRQRIELAVARGDLHDLHLFGRMREGSDERERRRASDEHRAHECTAADANGGCRHCNNRLSCRFRHG